LNTEYEIDHLFVCSSVGAPEAERLAKFGLTEGSGNTHQGQGTTNRRFFFHNAMLELLWVADPQQTRGDVAGPTLLWDRWVGRGQVGSPSPFGVCLRPPSPGGVEPPFSTWSYRPPYLPPELTIEIAATSPLNEPMWFFIPFGRRPDAVKPDLREPLLHSIGLRELTDVRIVVPLLESLSTTAAGVIRRRLLSVVDGPQPLLELTFDGDRGGRIADFRPALPLLFHW
jgi:Glyoxalase-like domain